METSEILLYVRKSKHQLSVHGRYHDSILTPCAFLESELTCFDEVPIDCLGYTSLVSTRVWVVSNSQCWIMPNTRCQMPAMPVMKVYGVVLGIFAVQQSIELPARDSNFPFIAHCQTFACWVLVLCHQWKVANLVFDCIRQGQCRCPYGSRLDKRLWVPQRKRFDL